MNIVTQTFLANMLLVLKYTEQSKINIKSIQCHKLRISKKKCLYYWRVR